MAYGDKIRLEPHTVDSDTYRDGTVMPHLQVDVYLTPVETGVEEYVGYVELHFHRTKYESRLSLGLTSRLGRGAQA